MFALAPPHICMLHSSKFGILPSDLNVCIDRTSAVRRSARIHGSDQPSPSTEEPAFAVVRGVLEASIAGDSGGGCKDRARLRRESEVVMVFGRVSGSAISHLRQ